MLTIIDSMMYLSGDWESVILQIEKSTAVNKDITSGELYYD